MSLKRYALGLAAVGLSSVAVAQPPVVLPIPGGPGAFPPMSAPLPAPGAMGIAPRPAMPTQNTLWSYMGVSADQREYRQRARADTPLGQLRAMLPGGDKLKTPTLAELQAPGPVGAAAQVKMDRVNAEKRMEAVAYLGTVDCHYWPEAEEALIGALRGDRNECVRLQAANVLLNGCCCTKKVIKALAEAASGTDCDGFPAEKSARVRAAAQAALEKCLMCFCDMESKCPDKNCDKKPEPLPKLDEAPKPKPLETGPDGKKGAMAESYYNRVARMPAAEIIADARKALLIAIPMEISGPTINQADLIAAGEPGPDLASVRSPRPTSLMNVLSAKPTTPGVTPIASRPMGSTNMVIHHTVPTWKPAADWTATEPAPMAVVNPASSKGPVPPQVVAAKMATSAVPTPAVKTMPVSHVAPRVNQGEQVAKMMKGLVPVSELASGIDQLSAEDLRANPGLTSELIAAGARSSSVPVRTATIKALVRCRVSTPEAMTVLKTAAQTDPEATIRAAASGITR